MPNSSRSWDYNLDLAKEQKSLHHRGITRDMAVTQGTEPKETKNKVERREMLEKADFKRAVGIQGGSQRNSLSNLTHSSLPLTSPLLHHGLSPIRSQRATCLEGSSPPGIVFTTLSSILGSAPSTTIKFVYFVTSKILYFQGGWVVFCFLFFFNHELGLLRVKVLTNI